MVRMHVEALEQRTGVKRWRSLLPWLLVAALACANVASLLSVRFHAWGFSAVEKVMTTVGGRGAEAVLNASPTRIAARERQAFSKASVAVRNIARRTSLRLAVHSAEAVAGIPARVLPFVGTAAVVAATASDVRSDCATVNEMNEVLTALGGPTEDPGAVCNYVNKVPSASDAWASAKRRAGSAAASVMDLAERLLSRK